MEKNVNKHFLLVKREVIDIAVKNNYSCTIGQYPYTTEATMNKNKD